MAVIDPLKRWVLYKFMQILVVEPEVIDPPKRWVLYKRKKARSSETTVIDPPKRWVLYKCLSNKPYLTGKINALPELNIHQTDKKVNIVDDFFKIFVRCCGWFNREAEQATNAPVKLVSRYLF